MNFTKEFRKRFWSKVEKGSECWEWRAYKSPAGYGMIQARTIHPVPMLAHRVAWELRNGPIPDGLFVLHRCDNPACVRAAHLFLGTQADNNFDRDRKGRTASGDANGARTKPHRNPFVRNCGSGLTGERHPGSKLTQKDVDEIRRLFAAGMNRHQIAKRFGISDTHANRIVTGASWKD